MNKENWEEEFNKKLLACMNEAHKGMSYENMEYVIKDLKDFVRKEKEITRAELLEEIRQKVENIQNKHNLDGSQSESETIIRINQNTGYEWALKDILSLLK